MSTIQKKSKAYKALEDESFDLKRSSMVLPPYSFSRTSSHLDSIDLPSILKDKV